MFALAFALFVDRLIGDPDWLWRRVPHPVVWVGWLIDRADAVQTQHCAGKRAKFAAGALLLVLMALLALALHAFVFWLAGEISLLGWGLQVAILVVLLAQKSLHDHGAAVAEALSRSVAEGRSAVAMIVGRDVSALGESGVSAAAIESLAENFSDGIVAPVLWYVMGGIGGIAFYKMVNTADSMIGHRTERHLYFGKPAARLDDVLNWPAARLTALLVALACALAAGITKARRVLRLARRDARHHRSPNAGWPETAFAACLGIRLGGPRNYGDMAVDGAWLNGEGRSAQRGDVVLALRLLRGCYNLLLCIVVFAALAAAFAGLSL